SSSAEDRDGAMKRGARNFMVKPLSEEVLDRVFADISVYSSKKIKKLLLIDDNEQDLKELESHLGAEDVEITTAGNVKDAKELVRSQNYDCIILDLLLPDASGL